MHTLETLPFENRFAQLPDSFYARVRPTPLEKAFLIHANEAAADLIDLDPAEMQRPAFVEYFGGETLFPGGDHIAMLYAGHQFGNYVPQLGDGRAIMLGESQSWELQLKGSGETPFSRNSDGRAVLRSTIREYLCSEAMHGLGIPTTRALCMMGSKEEVYREQIEMGAMLVRMAPSHIRFGSFEVFFHRRQHDHLETLADFLLAHHYSELRAQDDPYLALLREVVTRTAKLMAQWQCIGFAHGVMNTDNMSMLGLTLDYGPFAFLDTYDPKFICNHSDYHGRYAFQEQPAIGLWNLNCLAHAFLPLLSDDANQAVEKARSVLEQYQPIFQQAWLDGMRAKLGLQSADIRDDGRNDESDKALITGLLDKMCAGMTDFTIFFRKLSDFDQESGAKNAALRDLFVERGQFDAWAEQYRQRLQQEQASAAERKAQMDAVNPAYILRNYMAQVAIEKAEAGDYSEVERLFTLLQQPFTEQAGMEQYAAHPPAWANDIEVSCSS